jgi:hypothetical protein
LFVPDQPDIPNEIGPNEAALGYASILDHVGPVERAMRIGQTSNRPEKAGQLGYDLVGQLTKGERLLGGLLERARSQLGHF